MKLGGEIGYRLLSKVISSRLPNGQPVFKSTLPSTLDLRKETDQEQFSEKFGMAFLQEVQGRRVVDFGCGKGFQAVALAELGAEHVVGIDINRDHLDLARSHAAARGVSGKCRFLDGVADREDVKSLREMVDVIYTIDAFEHIVETGSILEEMWRLLAPGGEVYVWFGPVWWHPRGVHMGYLKPIPWTHLIFSEESIMRVRDEYRMDGKRKYSEINLSQMTVGKFRQFLAESPFHVAAFEAIPIHHCQWLARIPRIGEFFTSVVRCRLIKPREQIDE